MEANETVTRLEVRCPEERAVIGTISIPVGQAVKLTAAEVLRRFEPATQAFRLSTTRAPLRDNDYLRCPRCTRPVTIHGKLDKDFEGDATVVLGALTVKG
jgi:hypothetical protein